MPFNKNDPRINRNGRPSGSKNKVRATRVVSKAMNAGMSLEDICVTLTEIIQNKKTSEVQKNQALKQLIDIKKFLTTTEIKLIDDKLALEKGSKPEVHEPKGKVEQFPKTVFKKRSS